MFKPIETIELCCLGCRTPARFVSKSGKFYCSSNANKCTSKRMKDSAAKKGINPFEGKEHPKGAKGKTWKLKKTHIPWNKGLCGDVRCSQEPKTEDARRIKSEKCRKAIQERYDAGWNPKAGRCKKIKYVSPIAGEVLLDGTWELTVAQHLDKKGYNWQRNTKRFQYINTHGKLSNILRIFLLKNLTLTSKLKDTKLNLIDVSGISFL